MARGTILSCVCNVGMNLKSIKTNIDKDSIQSKCIEMKNKAFEYEKELINDSTPDETVKIKLYRNGRYYKGSCKCSYKILDFLIHCSHIFGFFTKLTPERFYMQIFTHR